MDVCCRDPNYKVIPDIKGSFSICFEDEDFCCRVLHGKIKVETLTKLWLAVARTTRRITTTLTFVASQRRNQGGVGSLEVMGNKWTIQCISQHDYSLFSVQDLLFTSPFRCWTEFISFKSLYLAKGKGRYDGF